MIGRLLKNSEASPRNAGGLALTALLGAWALTFAGLLPSDGQEAPSPAAPLQNITFTSLAPDVQAPEPAATPRPANAIALLRTSYETFPPALLVSTYDGFWQDIQDSQANASMTPDAARVLSDRMQAIWAVMQDQGIATNVGAPAIHHVTQHLADYHG